MLGNKRNGVQIENVRPSNVNRVGEEYFLGLLHGSNYFCIVLVDSECVWCI